MAQALSSVKLHAFFVGVALPIPQQNEQIVDTEVMKYSNRTVIQTESSFSYVL